MADEAEIRAFLLDVKRVAKDAQNVKFIPTDKNRNALATLGMSVTEIIRIITCLEPRDYHAGPEGDRDGSPGIVMTFLRPYDRTLMYVKLKLFSVNGVQYLKILSFHEEGQHD